MPPLPPSLPPSRELRRSPLPLARELRSPYRRSLLPKWGKQPLELLLRRRPIAACVPACPEEDADMPAAAAARVSWQVWAVLLCALLCAHGVVPIQAGECKELKSCKQCVEGEVTLNITDCVWMHCQESKEKPGTSSCVRKGEPAKEKCSFHNDTAACEAPKVTTKEPPHPTTQEPPRPASREPEVITSRTTASPPLTGSPEFHPPGFDSASFIGGIVLVLSIQAVIFFVIKFLRSKDSTYQTLI
uniref:CD164 molecule like 2 n=1 Tax=Salvator merianae TaxID=96440 RepID=A0A8D0B6B6_SALMN